MSLVVYNTLSRQKEEFKPLEPGKVLMYVCGVTVYDDPHIGHARCYTAFDVIHRHLKASGNEVVYVRNFTDIDDKIIKRAGETGEDWKKLTQRYIQSFSEDMASLGCLPATQEPKATAHIPQIIKAVKSLVDSGDAYEAEGDVYFRVESRADYGKLSGRKLEDMQAGARVEVNQLKTHPMDFVLWKASKPGEPSWKSPWGPGRPGWHIECSVMSSQYLGRTFDIHGGGADLVFPHHENEIAQSEALNHQPFANYWLHNGFVRVDQEKMSKSLGNFFTIKDVLKKVRPEVLRYFLLSKHYRSPLDFSDAALGEAGQGLERLYTALLNAHEKAGDAAPPPAPTGGDESELAQAHRDFLEGMDDDFNTPRALGALFNLAKALNRLAADQPTPDQAQDLAWGAAQIRELGGRLGILQEDPQAFLQGLAASGQIDSAEVERLVAQRTQARAAKDFAQADAIRDQLAQMGIALDDTPSGTRWRLGG